MTTYSTGSVKIRSILYGHLISAIFYQILWMKNFTNYFSQSEGKCVLLKTRLRDRGGRRLFSERRCFSYSIYYPKGRSMKERRSGLDRRNRLRFYKNEIITEHIGSQKCFELLTVISGIMSIFGIWQLLKLMLLDKWLPKG
jgi:hypothetical protein